MNKQNSFLIGWKYGECWLTSLEDSKNNQLKIFTPAIYYMGLQRDQLFQSILDTIHELEQAGWKYKDALDRAIQWKKVDIRSKLGHPFVPGLRYLVNISPLR